MIWSPDGVDRIERGHRLLEDHRDLVAADLLHLLLGRVEQVPALEADLAADDAPGRVGTSRRMERAVTLLPQPDFAHHAEVSPLRTE